MNALQRAISLRQPPPSVIHHSDRGSQYCSGDYQKLLAKHEIVPSMSGKGNCYDCDCGDGVQDDQIRADLAHQLCQPPGRHQGHWQLH